MTALIFIGPPGTGKTSIVEELESLGWLAADIHHAVARILNVHVAELHLDTDPAQRIELEREVLGALLDDVESATEGNYALAVPSSALGLIGEDESEPLRERILKAAGAGALTVIQLQTELGKLVMRNGLVGVRSSNVVLPRKELRAHIERHQPTYDLLATRTIDTTESDASSIAVQINAEFGAAS